MIDLKLPKINAERLEERVSQMQSFLYQHVEELDYALNQIQKDQDTTTEAIKEVKNDDSGIDMVMSKVNSLGRATTEIKADADGLELRVQKVEKDVTEGVQEFADAIGKLDDDVSSLQSQIDGSITTWFYEVAPTTSNAPAKDWTTTEAKNIHLGDLYYDTVTGYCYRWQLKDNTYSWQRITDTDVTKALEDASKAQDTADSKRRVFVAEPKPPYDIGDMWVQGSTGDIMRCATTRASGNYVASDWVKASKYTDDTKAKAVEEWVKNEAYVKVTDEAITSKVSREDYTGANIASLINQSASNVQIAAEHVDIAGKVTFSDFNADTQKKINDISGVANGASSTASSAKTKADAISTNLLYGGTTEINGGKIKTNTIKATQIDTDDLFSKNITATNMNITGGSVQINADSDTYSYMILQGVDGDYFYKTDIGLAEIVLVYGFDGYESRITLDPREQGIVLNRDGNTLRITPEGINNRAVLQGIKVNNGTPQYADANGLVNLTVSGGSSYTLPTASATVLGGIKVGTNLNISNGVLSAVDTTYSNREPLSGGTNVSLVTDGDKYKWNNKQDKITSSNKLAYSLLSGTPTIPTTLPANGGTATSTKNQGGYSGDETSLGENILTAGTIWINFRDKSGGGTSTSATRITQYNFGNRKGSTAGVTLNAASFSGTAANASKLNNQEASYYLNYNNLSNKPTIPSTSGLATQASVNTKLSKPSNDVGSDTTPIYYDSASGGFKASSYDLSKFAQSATGYVQQIVLTDGDTRDVYNPSVKGVVTLPKAIGGGGGASTTHKHPWTKLNSSAIAVSKTFTFNNNDYSAIVVNGAYTTSSGTWHATMTIPTIDITTSLRYYTLCLYDTYWIIFTLQKNSSNVTTLTLTKSNGGSGSTWTIESVYGQAGPG